MFKKHRLSVLTGMIHLLVSGASVAATGTTNIPVSASVSQSCSITTAAALAFGAYDPIGVNASAPLNATGQVSVACSKGATGLTIGMDNGTNVLGVQRQMKGSASTGNLQYNLYQPPSDEPSTACVFPGSTPWSNTGAGLLKLTSAPTKVARLYNVCGTIPGGQDVAVGLYTDIVSATLNF
jgi:spore coat protein U-like protein